MASSPGNSPLPLQPFLQSHLQASVGAVVGWEGRGVGMGWGGEGRKAGAVVYTCWAMRVLTTERGDCSPAGCSPKGVAGGFVGAGATRYGETIPTLARGK